MFFWSQWFNSGKVQTARRPHAAVRAVAQKRLILADFYQKIASKNIKARKMITFLSTGAPHKFKKLYNDQ